MFGLSTTPAEIHKDGSQICQDPELGVLEPQFDPDQHDDLKTQHAESSLAETDLCKSHKEELVVGQVDRRKSVLLSVLLDPGAVRLQEEVSVKEAEQI